MRIFETHEHTLKYVDEMGLELAPYDTGTRAFHLQGRRFLAPPTGTPWPLRRLRSRRAARPRRPLPAVPALPFDTLGDISDPSWPGAFPSALELDRTTLAGYMRAQGASNRWLDWFFAHEGRIARANAAASFAVEAISAGDDVRSIKVLGPRFHPDT